MELKKGDVVKIERGMMIKAKIPEKFAYPEKPFSNKFVESSILVGKKYHYPREATTPLETVKSEIETKIVQALSGYGIQPITQQDKIANFIESLELKEEHDEFSGSIYEGDYEVTHVDKKEYLTWVYCTKVDDSCTTIRFNLTDNFNSNVKVVSRA